ncbi:MAG: HDIG domain-containing protein [Prevotella sp.]|nr:HDIG domain-containing protein [Prevotella sp.]
MNYQQIIDKYYPEDNDLRRILLIHSQSVAQKALQIVVSHPELKIDHDFILSAAMLHDIGIVRTYAPGIECFGTEPYIRHGMIGATMMREEGYEDIARICERHTGAGLSLDDIVSQDLPLPHQSFLPETIEEQLICYADKFYSKSHLEREKTIEQAERSLAKFGTSGVERFRHWVEIFE